MRGITLVEAVTQGTGQARIRSFDGALGIQYRLFTHARLHADLTAGLHVMTLQGSISITGESRMTSIIGDAVIPFEDSETFEELRNDGLDVRNVLIYPSIALSLGWQFHKGLGFLTRLTFSQGLFLSLGLWAGF